MADVVTFDPINLIIEEINTGLPSNELDLVEIYSEWKDWLLADASRMKYPQAFRYVGADPISDIQNLGSTFFINAGDGWHIRPAEYDHQLIITGNLFTDPAGLNRTVPTVGNYTVEVTYNVSNLVDASVARLDLTQLLQAVYIDTVSGTPGTGTDVGTPTNPVSNIADARIIADRDGLRAYKFRGDLVLDQDYSEWDFDGIAAERASNLDLNGQTVDKTKFTDCVLSGEMAGTMQATDCGINVFTSIAGVFRGCGFLNNFSIQPGGTAVFADCFSEVAGTDVPSCDLNGGSMVSFRNYSGGLELENVIAGAEISVDLDPGSLFLGPTNTGGIVLVRGIGTLTDTSTGTTVVNQLQNASTVAVAVWESLAADYPDPLTMGGSILASLASIIADIGSGVDLSATQTLQLKEIWQILGLDAANVLTVSKTARTAGTAVTQTIQEDVPVAGSVRVTKT